LRARLAAPRGAAHFRNNANDPYFSSCVAARFHGFRILPVDGISLMTPGESSAKPPRDKRRVRLGLRVLVVEDDEQVASVLSTLLETEGYETTVSNTAEGGLDRLRHQHFHLLVSDYWLPDRTGAWMLHEASASGYLRNTAVLVVTAEHRPQGVENLTVLRKPLDLDDFLRNVHDVLAPVRQEEMLRATQELESAGAPETEADGARVELSLYTSAGSPSSLKAVRNLMSLLSNYDPVQVRLSVRDLSREAHDQASEDRIAFTPTLVKRNEPKVWVLGSLDDIAVVEDLLAHAGVDRKK
jgi:CheY-like chemotaxis protein